VRSLITVERPIEITAVLARPAGSVIGTFLERGGALLGTVTGGDGEHQRVVVRLTVGPSAVDQDVACVVSEVTGDEGGASMRVRWRPIRYDRWLPSFDGVLAVLPIADETLVSLDGSYEIPMGTVGAFGDGIVGRRLAKRTLTALMAEIAASLDGDRPYTGVVVADDSGRAD
jgi:hypothetical protein